MTDSQLWKEFIQGSKLAFESIYRQNFKNLYSYGYRICQNEMLVEDCIQNLFIELWKNKSGLGDTDSIGRYLSVSLRRKIIKELKKSSAKEVSRELSETDLGGQDSFEAKLVMAEGDSEKARKMQKAFEVLSSREKEAIYLKYFDGMDYEDIGDIMGINYQSIRNLVSRAIKKLQKAVKTIILILFLLT